jgi:adenylate cyclase
MATSGKNIENFNPYWQAMLSGEHPALRRGRRLYRMLSPTAHNRCRLCFAGFDGFTAPAMRLMGRGRWLRNPHFCEKCEAALEKERGGVELEIAMLYADVRGSTELAASIGPAKFAALMERFFQIAVTVFGDTDAVVDKMVGDEVIGIFLPDLTGSDYRQRAVAAALELLRATGHDDPHGPWLSIGVGVHAGITFVGSIGVEGGSYQFAALGDPMNFCARLVGAAKGGEMVISETVCNDVSDKHVAERRSVELDGYAAPVNVYVTRLDPNNRQQAARPRT